MKMKFTVFDAQTGRVLRWGECPEEGFGAQAMTTGETVVEGEYPEDTFYWDGATMAPKPPRPSQFHDWDYAQKAWVPDTTAATAARRAQRDARLRASDWTQLPDIAAATQTAWQSYRQALRDVPAQPGFPFVVTWPTPPA